MKAGQVDAVVAEMEQGGREVFVRNQILAHRFGVHHDAVDQFVGEAQYLPVEAGSEIAVRALAGEYEGRPEGARDGDAEAVQRVIKGVDDLDAMGAQIRAKLPCTAQGVRAHEGGNRKAEDANARAAKFFGADAFAKTGDVNLKERAIERAGDFG